MNSRVLLLCLMVGSMALDAADELKLDQSGRDLHPVPLNDPSITPALTGSGFRPGDAVVHIHQKDGSEWPSQTEK